MSSSLTWLSIDCRGFIDDDLFLTSAREEHAVDLITIGAIHKDMFTVEGFLQNLLGLICPSKDELIKSAAAFLDAGFNCFFQALHLPAQIIDITLIGSILEDNRDGKPGEKSLLLCEFFNVVMNGIYIVVELPEGEELACREPRVCEA